MFKNLLLFATLTPAFLPACMGADAGLTDEPSSERASAAPSPSTDEDVAPSETVSEHQAALSCNDLVCYHDGCTDSANSREPACVAAESRFCGDRGFAMGMSLENVFNRVSVGCVAAPFRQDISMFELKARIPGCDANWKSQQPECMAAVHRACVARGYGAGMSQEVGANWLAVACVPAGWAGDVSIAELKARIPGCDANWKSQKPECAAAVHRACVARGFSAGLSQEVGANVLGVACFNASFQADVPVI